MKSPRVIVVEDQRYLREIVVELLEVAGYPAAGIAGGAEALARLPDLDPELILVDMSMPGMDGREFLARLRAEPRWAALPVLIVSALDEALQPPTGPGIALLRKPFDATALIDHTRRLIGPARTAAPASPRLAAPSPGA